MIRDDAEAAVGASAGYSIVRQHGLSADGRFLVFDSDRTLVEGDANGTYDIFLRDRQTGGLTRVSVASDGTEADRSSFAPSLSANGRHVLFLSWASNLDPTDTNGVFDLYVRDLVTGVTSLVTVGPSGQQLSCNCVPQPNGRLSGDGRFVAFAAQFALTDGPSLWLRDRDPDQNGVFDEPGTAVTLSLDLSALEGDRIWSLQDVTVSNDARYVAFAASAIDASEAPLGTRVYLHDRSLGTTIRVDRPISGSADVVALSLAPDFSDNGQVAFTSTAPHLVDGDADASADVFVHDIATATTTRLQLSHAAIVFAEAAGTAISADGRFVAFTGYEDDGAGGRWNVYAIDRQIQTSFDISVRIDGTRDDGASGAAMSADGSAIAFNGGMHILQQGGIGLGVYVATSVTVTSTETEAPMEGGLVPVEIAVPAGTFWTASLVSGSWGDYVTYSTYSGVGPGTIDVEIPFNTTGQSTAYQFWLGSEVVSFQQDVRPITHRILPNEGPATGGTAFQITGFGFQAGASVTFDGVPATDIAVEEGGYSIFGVTPPHVAGEVHVVVTNPDGATNEFQLSFYYYDDTPPVVTATVGGMLGANGWYTSNVTVTWTVDEIESELYETSCDTVTQTTDVAARVVSCYAISGGGSITEQVVIKRDTTPPAIVITQPQAQEYVQGQSVAPSFSCSDATSGVATCTANQTGTLATSTPGTFTFVVTAVDHAGHTSQASVTYTVRAAKVDTSLALVSSPNPSHPNQDVTLTATVSPVAGAGVPTGVVELRINGVLVGSAPLVNGVATGTVTFKKGSYALTATYGGDADFSGSSGTLVHRTK